MGEKKTDKIKKIIEKIKLKKKLIKLIRIFKNIFGLVRF
jgi:hypothetical protein